MRARTTAVLLVGVAGLLVLYMAVRAADLIATGELTGILLGIGVLLLVVVGAVLLYGEVRFGLDSERLGRRLADEGGLPTLPEDVAAAAQRAAHAGGRRRRCSSSARPRSRPRPTTGGRGSGSPPRTATPATPRAAAPPCAGPCGSSASHRGG